MKHDERLTRIERAIDDGINEIWILDYSDDLASEGLVETIGRIAKITAAAIVRELSDSRHHEITGGADA